MYSWVTKGRVLRYWLEERAWASAARKEAWMGLRVRACLGRMGLHTLMVQNSAAPVRHTWGSI